MSKCLSDIISGLDFLDIQGNIGQPVTGLSYDSRECKPGHLFFALPGIHTDGKHYIQGAIQRGAVGVVYEGGLDLPGAPGNIAFLRAADCRWMMSAISGRFYGNPSDSLCVIGVTGTEGKSTTVSLIYQLLRLAGYRAGFFSTVMSDTGSGERPNPQHQTTPESTAVQGMLAQMRDGGLSIAVAEATLTSGLGPTSPTNTSNSTAPGNSIAATRPTSSAAWAKAAQSGCHAQRHAFPWASSAPTIRARPILLANPPLPA